MKHYYSDFGLTKPKDMDWLKMQQLHNIFKRPVKELGFEMPRYNQVAFSPNVMHVADLLFLPKDKGYNYALIVTDVATRLSDGVPLKTRKSAEVQKGFQTIYKRGILSLPQKIRTDPGNEFKGEVKVYFDKNGVIQKFGIPGRHRQVSIVERSNLYLGKAIGMRQQAQEILTDATSKEWVDDLPNFIKAMNKRRQRNPPQPQFQVKVQKDKELIPIGTKVRAILDNPIGYVHEKRLHGGFRAADLRWNPEVRQIGNILLLPGQPPMYELLKKGRVDHSVAYTKKQVQIIPKGEQEPDKKVIRGQPDTWVVKKILAKKKANGVNKYLIRWKGFGPQDDTWERKENLFGADMPAMIAKFEKKWARGV